ncbi:phage distal tail protein [Pseudarthrobacter sp. H2]|uniref:phage distal tail protein n=1 Tax=Pseudarthrobacter sp. H2 TaxID=3418415 RepID=UPI003CF32837
MIISLNGFVLNDPNSVNAAYLDEPIEGLGLPPIRTSSGNYSGRDGGYVGSQFYGMRLITLTGQFFGTPATLETTRRNLAAAVATSSVAMNITTNAGNQYLVNCNIDSLDMPILRSINQAPFKISLIATDPTIYDNSASGLMSVTVNPARGGGITWPITWPITWAAGSQPTTVNNTGNVTIYPTITLINKMTNPSITNQTTGQFFTLTGLTTTAGDTLVIDMKNRTVLLNGGSVLPFVTSSSSWWPLLPGNNSINLTTADGTDTTVATVSWRSGYRGI